jgi:hypothetical protein
MADNTTVHIGENSPEQVAYKLMHDVARAEKITLAGMGTNSNRDWILDTYAKCIRVVRAAHYEP